MTKATTISIRRIVQRRMVAICIEVNFRHFMKAMITHIPIISEEIQFISVNHQDNTTPRPMKNEITSIILIYQKNGLFIVAFLKSQRT